MSARDRAVKTLKHYLLYFQGHRDQTHGGDASYNSDNVIEIESIIDDIIEAAATQVKETIETKVEEAREEMLEEYAPETYERKHQKQEFPLQPLIWDGSKNAYYREGHIKFQQNDIVRYLLDCGPFDLNHIAMLPNIPNSHHEQFAQLIGYTVGGFAELSYVGDAACEKATLLANEMQKKGTKNTDRDT